MSTLKVTSVQHASAASAAITLASDGTATAQLSSLNGGPLAGARNRIINGDMRIDARNNGASVTAGVAYPVDRFLISSIGSNFSAQRSTTAPSGFTNSTLVTVTSSATPSSGDYRQFLQQIEGFNVADLAFGTASASAVTLSFWIRSSVTGTYSGGLINSAGNRSYVFTYSISAANTWEYKTVTIPGDTSGAWLTDNGIGFSLRWDLGSGSTYTASAGSWQAGTFIKSTGSTSLSATNGATWMLTGVQLEAGSAATPFERRSYGQELALCQRYYETGDYYIRVGVANASIVTSYYTRVYFMAEKRIIPTVTGTNDQGTFSSNTIRTTSTGVGRSNVVANTTNSGTFVADAEL